MSKAQERQTAENQKNINSAYKLWSSEHASRYRHVGNLPYLPALFPDQRIEKAYRRVTRASVYLPETAYLKGLEWIFAKALGSKTLAEAIIMSFDTTPASLTENSPSLTDFAIDNLQSGQSFGIAAGHIDRLTDVAEFTQGLSLAVARREGRKYVDRFRVLVNKNMTRETFYRVPSPWLGSIGIGVYWGSPFGESADKHGVSEAAINEINTRFSQQYIRDKKIGAVVLGFVPSMSGMTKTINPATGELQSLEMKDASGAASIVGHCEGGIIPTNRYQNKIAVSPVMEVAARRPEGITKKQFNRQLVEELSMELASQASGLTEVPVRYGDTMVFPNSSPAR